MAQVLITSPAEYIPDPIKDKPVFNGKMYIGEPDLDPQIPDNQKQVSILNEDGTTTPINQPISISAGGVFVDDNGDFIRIVVDGNYSQKILDRFSSQVYYVDNKFNGDPLTTESGVIIISPDNVDDMKDTNLTPGQYAETRGYHEAGDGGGAKYLIQTLAEFGSTPDGYGDHLLTNGNVAKKVKSNYINVKQFGAVGDASTDDALPLQAAFDRAQADIGNTVFVPKGTFMTTATLYIATGTVLEGAGVGTPTALDGVSTIKAKANLTYLITQKDINSADQPFTIKNISIHGNKNNFTVDTGVALRGRQIRITDCIINDCSGTGLHILPTIGSPFDPSWVNWVKGCLVSRNGEYGIKNEGSDSFFMHNYFSENPKNWQKISGGNAWIGNHFDNAEVGFQIVWDDNWYAINGVTYRVADRLIGNYFDNNIIGLQIDGTTTGSAPSRSQSEIVCNSNRFRANNLHIDLIRLQSQMINSCLFTENVDKAPILAPDDPLAGLVGGIRWTNCTDGAVNSSTFDVTYTYPDTSMVTYLDGFNEDAVPMFVNKPGSTTVRSSKRQDTGGTSPIYSERQSTALIPSGQTSTTVTHRLFDQPVGPLVTQRGGGAGAFYNVRVANITQTTFDIEIDSAASGNQQFNWVASYTQ